MTPNIVALVPAHNEEASVGQTVLALRSQTVPPSRIIVISDNSTDRTIEVARQAGAEVMETVGNTAKKAGALNQALEVVLPGLSAEDMILAMDADSVLISEWIELGIPNLLESVGGISGAYMPRYLPGLVPTLQSVEYAQERRRIARKGGYVDVLSGTAALFHVRTLRQVSDSRGGPLPGIQGQVYDESSLTEDFELTIALQTLGYRPRCPIECKVITDVMPSWASLAVQRIRWQRGTIETLQNYGWSVLTRRLWILQGWTYLRTGAWPLVVVMYLLTLALFGGVAFHPLFFAIVPVLILEQVVTAWRAGVRGRVVAGLLIPGIIYDNFRSWVYWIALVKSIKKSEKTWVTN